MKSFVLGLACFLVVGFTSNVFAIGPQAALEAVSEAQDDKIEAFANYNSALTEKGSATTAIANLVTALATLESDMLAEGYSQEDIDAAISNTNAALSLANADMDAGNTHLNLGVPDYLSGATLLNQALLDYTNADYNDCYHNANDAMDLFVSAKSNHNVAKGKFTSAKNRSVWQLEYITSLLNL